MAPELRWQDPAGRSTITEIVKKQIPEWKNGLHDWQLNLVARILDGDDIFCCTATGDGKSALFAVPIIVLREIGLNPGLYDDLKYPEFPVGLVVTPTKGLAANMVKELAQLKVPALAYSHETLTTARRSGRKIAKDIKECKTWNIICVDPEHLRDAEWREITEWPVFRNNIMFGCVDEAHLINEWGRSFRFTFLLIGSFLRGRLPNRISVFALSATLQPGPDTDAVTKSLGMIPGAFTLLRRSNERPNMQFIIEVLGHGLGSSEFPCLLPYLASGRKTVVHCRTVEMVFRAYVYCWRMLPAGVDKLRRLRTYHALCRSEYNEGTVRLLQDDPHCQIVIATIAFANGLNVKPLLDSLSLGFGDTLDQVWQEKGRVGRDAFSSSRGVVFVQPSAFVQAEKRIKEHEAASSTDRPSLSPSTGRHNKKGATPMDLAKAYLLVEKTCYIACLNRIYGNLPLSTTTLDCIAAGRPLPCSLCMSRTDRVLTFAHSPLPDGCASIVPFCVSTKKPCSGQAATRDKKLCLTRKERTEAGGALLAFGESVFQHERNLGTHPYRPRSSFFPSPMVQVILDQLMKISTVDDLSPLTAPWRHRTRHTERLLEVITRLRLKFENQRKEVRAQRNSNARAAAAAKRQAKARTESTESTSAGRGSKRPALDNITNPQPPKRLARGPRAPVLGAAVVSESYGPSYRTRRRALPAETSDENSFGMGASRSSWKH